MAVSESDSRPVADPTTLTTEALQREIAALRDVLDTELRGMGRIEDEKFRRVEQQFELVERQRVEQKSDTKEAVNAALIAQKEAVKEQTIASERAIAKSEASITKQLEQLTSTFQTEIGSLRRDIDDAKQRVTAVEQKKVGGTEAKTSTYALAAFVVALIVIGTFAAALLTKGVHP